MITQQLSMGQLQVGEGRIAWCLLDGVLWLEKQLAADDRNGV